MPAPYDPTGQHAVARRAAPDPAETRREEHALYRDRTIVDGGIDRDSRSPEARIQAGAPSVRPSAPAAPAAGGQSALQPRPDVSPDVSEVALDLMQLGLDVTGIFEPTPFSDGANAVISLFRGDWIGAGTSAVAMVPYAGDLAKLGKLQQRIPETLDKVLHVARDNPAAVAALRKALEMLGEKLDRVPVEKLPEKVRVPIQALKDKLDEGLTALAAHGFKFEPRGPWQPPVAAKNADYLKQVADRIGGKLVPIGNLPLEKAQGIAVDGEIRQIWVDPSYRRYRNVYEKAQASGLPNQLKPIGSGEEVDHVMPKVRANTMDYGYVLVVPVDGKVNRTWGGTERELSAPLARSPDQGDEAPIRGMNEMGLAKVLGATKTDPGSFGSYLDIYLDPGRADILKYLEGLGLIRPGASAR